MKLLFFTDPHLTAKSPEGRLDVYYLATMRKLLEIGQMIKQQTILGEEIIVVIGGDLFHTPRVSLKYAGQIAKIIEAWGVKVYVVPGNHDIYGYNIDTIDQTMLGMFANTGVVTLLTRSTPLDIYSTFNGNMYELAIEGQEYYEGIDKGNPKDFDINIKADLNILVTHSMLMPKPFHPDVPCTLLKDVVTEADIVIAGHYHPGWKEEQHGDTLFMNPGSLLRIEATAHNKVNVPKIILYDIHENAMGDALEYSYEYIELKVATPGVDIFDYNTKQVVKQSANLLGQFKQSVNQTSALLNVTTIPDMITAIAKLTNVDSSVINKALGYITKAQIGVDDLSVGIKGFVDKYYKLGISSVTLHNFQSYKGTVTINFTDGLNAIIGESNKGKTAIIRAILWCLYNDPKGSDFITTGEDECYVLTKFTDNSSIKRSRTIKSAGSYIVTNSAGEVKEYKGFANDVPVEVMNEHQMPKVTLAKDLVCSLNVATQLDGPFLIKESPLNKAAAVGRIIGTQIIDSAIKTVNGESLNCNKEIKALEKLIVDNEKDLVQYSDLEDIELYMKMYEYLLDTYEKSESKLQEVKTLHDSHIRCINQITGVQGTISSLSNIDKLLPDIEKAALLVEKIERLQMLSTDLDRIRTDKVNEVELLNSLPNENITLQRISVMEEKISEVETLIRLRNDRIGFYKSIRKETELLTNCNPSLLEDFIKQIDDKLGVVSDLITLDANLTSIRNNIKNTQLSVDSDIALYGNKTYRTEALEKEMEQFIIDTGVCMLCGSKLTEEHAKHMIA